MDHRHSCCCCCCLLFQDKLWINQPTDKRIITIIHSLHKKKDVFKQPREQKKKIPFHLRGKIFAFLCCCFGFDFFFFFCCLFTIVFIKIFIIIIIVVVVGVEKSLKFIFIQRLLRVRVNRGSYSKKKKL